MKRRKYIIGSIILTIMFVGIFIPVLGFALTDPGGYVDPATGINTVTGYRAQSLGDDSLRGCFLENNPKFIDLTTFIVCNINRGVIPLLFALAVVMFIWGVVVYVMRSDDEAKKEKGRQFMIWGIIALAVMVSIWGLVAVLANTFGVGNVLPQVSSPPPRETTR